MPPPLQDTIITHHSTEIALEKTFRKLFWFSVTVILMAIAGLVLWPSVTGLSITSIPLYEDVFSLLREHGGRAAELVQQFIEHGFAEYFLNSYFLATSVLILITMLADWFTFAIKEKSLWRGWKHSALYRLVNVSNKSAQMDLVLFIYTRLSLYLIVVPVVSILGPGILYFLIVTSFGTNLLQIDNELVRFIAFLIVADFFSYLYHWLAHNHKAMWEIHKFHHSCTEMNIVTGTRDHPFEKAMQKLFTAFPLVLLGAPTDQFLAIILIQYAHGLLQHSNWNLSFGVLDWVFISPRMHRLHHSLTLEHWDKNYGVIFSVWDHIFGTLYKGKNHIPEFGVTDNYFNQKGIVYDFTMPLAKFIRQMLTHPLEMLPSRVQKATSRIKL